MQCEQVRLWGNDYTAGTLPAYKAAWVAQHLAGCEECERLVRRPSPASPQSRAFAEVAAAQAFGKVVVELGEPQPERPAMPLQRTIRRVAILAVTAIVLSAVAVIMGATMWLNGRATAGPTPALVSGAPAHGPARP